MAEKRVKYSKADHVALATQVDGRCPRCRKKLFYVKGGRTQTGYELAHIYPLNPSPEEVALLVGEELLHEDPNHPDNLIPLCTDCHTKFDKPRTVEDYRDLVAIKKRLLQEEKQASLRLSFDIEEDIRAIVEKLSSLEDGDLINAGLELNPKKLSDKLEDFSEPLLVTKVHRNVAAYYRYVQAQFLELERQRPNVSTLIFSQVRTFYLKQKTLNISREEIVRNVVAWIHSKYEHSAIETAEIVASFFVQNCEVLE
jgi:hypothetical protein